MYIYIYTLYRYVSQVRLRKYMYIIPFILTYLPIFNNILLDVQCVYLFKSLDCRGGGWTYNVFISRCGGDDRGGGRDVTLCMRTQLLF